MEEIQEEKRIHHGRNVKLARSWKNMTQNDLAEKLNVYQTDISSLEKEEIISDEMLDKIAMAMDVSPDFFKNFKPDAVMKTYNQQNDINSAKDANDTINVWQGEVEVGELQQNTTNYPLDKVTELYERLLAEKDKQIEQLKK
ncbi:MAG TPA: transcriptional regulator [Dysgonomonas sp.]|nr:transcriptional regulator [Dysgonomonas sp.]